MLFYPSFTYIRSVLACFLATGLVLSAADEQAERFTDEVTGFSVAVPNGWQAESGRELREKIDAEARALGDPGLGAPAEEDAHQVILRLVQPIAAAGGSANLVVVVNRFDLDMIGEDITSEELLYLGLGIDDPSETPTRVGIAEREWVSLSSMFPIQVPDGRLNLQQEVFVIAEGRWGIALTLMAVENLFQRHQLQFREVLDSIAFRATAQDEATAATDRGEDAPSGSAEDAGEEEDEE